jgi:diketogulonate reductase-like aldo/keto reductase
MATAISATGQQLQQQLPALCQDLTLLGSPRTTTPRLVYGTAWKKDRTAELVYLALKAGFRGIDTAAQPKHYNEAGAGEGIRRAIAEGIVSRKEIFVRFLGEGLV